MPRFTEHPVGNNSNIPQILLLFERRRIVHMDRPFRPAGESRIDISHEQPSSYILHSFVFSSGVHFIFDRRDGAV
jgi:hypothetical protein